MDEVKIPSRTDRYKKAIHVTILSQLDVPRVRELRAEYASGRESIAELSQRTDVPPVLVWSLLTPLFEKTHIKHKLLHLETQIRALWTKGVSLAEIAKVLRIQEAEVVNYTTEQFSEKMYRLRPWYADRKIVLDPMERRWNEFMREDKLPPASRLGWKPGELMPIEADKLGRCPICGEMVHMPCYACTLKEFLKHHTVPHADEVKDIEEVDEILPDLMFR
jgi:hypothetical protein